MEISICHLKPECEKCFGLCCVALYFSEQDGFPIDKSAGQPCPKLGVDFRCTIHEKLGSLGLKGCIAYECFGAGQHVSQVTFAGQDWRLAPSSCGLMFEVFLIIRQLHEMCWYLAEALSFKPSVPICEEIREVLHITEHITLLPPHSLIEFELSAHRTKVNALLEHTSEFVRNKTNRTNKLIVNAEQKRRMPKDYFGKDLRKKNLKCADLRGACLIAADLEGVDLSGADFIGADLRDTNIRGANLSKSVFLIQSQINVAKGDSNTKLPPLLSHPPNWIS